MNNEGGDGRMFYCIVRITHLFACVYMDRINKWLLLHVNLFIWGTKCGGVESASGCPPKASLCQEIRTMKRNKGHEKIGCCRFFVHVVRLLKF